MSKRNKHFAGIIHQSTMVKWISFGYLLYARNIGVELAKAAEEFCNDSLVNDEGHLNPDHVRQEYYRTLERLMDARQCNSPESGAVGDSSGVKTGV